MRMAAVRSLIVAGTLPAIGQGEDEQFGAAVKRSLDRSRLLYPESTEPDSPLSRAILSRIEWLQRHNRAIFSDPNWPLRVTATEAAALGIPSTKGGSTQQPQGPRFLAVVTHNFSTAEASFRKDQQVVLESVQDYGKRGVTIVNGRPIVLWLDNLRILRELSPAESSPIVVKVESARYGIPGEQVYSVTAMVQSLISPDTSGRYEILVSDALLSPVAARKITRSTQLVMDPATGRQVVHRPDRVLTVTYTLNGSTKTRQAVTGERLVLD
jgi:hypothetical protein